MGGDAQIDTRTANAPVIGIVRSKEGLMGPALVQVIREFGKIGG